MTFKQWLIEHVNAGNYIGIKADDCSKFLLNIGLNNPITGTEPPNNDYHVTLMYSKDTDVYPNTIEVGLKRLFPNSIIANIIGADCFDSLPKNGERDEAKSCLVLKLEAPELNKIHNHLKILGLQHSYPEFHAHITLYYNMSVEEAHFLAWKINDILSKLPQRVILSNIYSETVNKDYV